MTRRIVVHRWPAVPAAEKTMPRMVRSRSALALTTAALLPPSSSSVRPNRPATRGPTAWPIRVDPVALSSATPGWSTRAWPTSAPPISTCDTSGGAPSSAMACWRIAAQASDVSGVSSDGFQTTGSPQTRATAVFHDQTAAGKLKALITPDDAERVPGLHQPVSGPLGRHGPAVQLPRQPHREVADVDHLLDLAAGLGRDLADLEADQRGQVVLVLGEQLRPPLDEGAAGGRGHLAPGQERVLRALDGLVDGGGVASTPAS